MLGDEAAAKAAAARQAAAGLSHWFRFILISAFLFIAIVLLCLVSVAQLPPAQAGTGMCRLNGKLITTMKQMNALEPLPVLPMLRGRNSNQIVAVELCVDLAAGPWSPLQTNTIADAPVYFVDPNWTNYPNRLYRIRAE
jgi:hypothetical protein